MEHYRLLEPEHGSWPQGMHLKAEPIQAVEVDNVSISANDVGPRQRKGLLSRFLAGISSNTIAQAQSLTTHVQ